MRDVSLHILDIAQNGIDAGATQLFITISMGAQVLVTIADNGLGMDAHTLKNATSSGFTTRKSGHGGMGLFELNKVCDNVELISTPGTGTLVFACFSSGFPLGDINKTVLVLLHCNPDIRFVIRFASEEERYFFDSRQLHEMPETEMVL